MHFWCRLGCAVSVLDLCDNLPLTMACGLCCSKNHHDTSISLLIRMREGMRLFLTRRFRCLCAVRSVFLVCPRIPQLWSITRLLVKVPTHSEKREEWTTRQFRIHVATWVLSPTTSLDTQPLTSAGLVTMTDTGWTDDATQKRTALCTCSHTCCRALSMNTVVNCDLRNEFEAWRALCKHKDPLGCAAGTSKLSTLWQFQVRSSALMIVDLVQLKSLVKPYKIVDADTCDDRVLQCACKRMQFSSSTRRRAQGWGCEQIRDQEQSRPATTVAYTTAESIQSGTSATLVARMAIQTRERATAPVEV